MSHASRTWTLSLPAAVVLATVVALGACKKEEPAPQPATPETAAKTEGKAAEPAAGKDEKAAEPEAKAGTAAAEEKAGEVEKAAEDAAAKVDEAVAKAAEEVADDSAALTEAKLDELLLALGTCELDDNGISRKCPAKKAFDEARNRNTKLKDVVGMYRSVGKKHIGDENPAVRLQAAELMGSIFGSDEETQKMILEATRAEKHPLVLKAMMRVVGSAVARSPEVRDLLIERLGHENEKVRMEAVTWLASRFAKDTEGTIEKVIEVIEKDPSDKVRGFACRAIGSRMDDRALDVLKKYTAKPEDNPALYSKCMEGLIRMWTGFPKPSEPSKKAYDLTLKRLKDKPRSKVAPPWTVMVLLGASTADPNNNFDQKWAEAAKWFRVEKLQAALVDIASDHNAHWMARTNALEALKKLGASKGTFEKIAKKYAGKKGEGPENGLVSRKLNEILGRTPEPKASAGSADDDDEGDAADDDEDEESEEEGGE